MSTSSFQRKHGTAIGPGGRYCSCCAPAPGKDWQAYCRASKKREKRLSKIEIKEEIEGATNGYNHPY